VCIGQIQVVKREGAATQGPDIVDDLTDRTNAPIVLDRVRSIW
jgi:hypothetical protein